MAQGHDAGPVLHAGQGPVSGGEDGGAGLVPFRVVGTRGELLVLPGHRANPGHQERANRGLPGVQAHHRVGFPQLADAAKIRGREQPLRRGRSGPGRRL